MWSKHLISSSTTAQHDDVIKWEHFPWYWPFVRGIHRSPVDSPHKGQWRRALRFSLTRDWTNGWANSRDTGDLRHHRAHYAVTVMGCQLTLGACHVMCCEIPATPCRVVTEVVWDHGVYIAIPMSMSWLVRIEPMQAALGQLRLPSFIAIRIHKSYHQCSSPSSSSSSSSRPPYLITRNLHVPGVKKKYLQVPRISCFLGYDHLRCSQVLYSK